MCKRKNTRIFQTDGSVNPKLLFFRRNFPYKTFHSKEDFDEQAREREANMPHMLEQYEQHKNKLNNNS